MIPDDDTFRLFLMLQPDAKIAGLLDEIGNELKRRHWPTMAAECKHAARDLRAIARHHETPV